MKLIVGLGNPGKEYERNRHNIGFIILDKYISSKGISNLKNGFNSMYSKTRIDDDEILVQKPLTFMNLSGNAIRELVSFYKLDPKKDLIVIYDDMDTEIGELKIKNKGSSGGHNGIKSIISNLGEEFIRIKIGIGKPFKGKDVISHVLGNFTEEEINKIEVLDKDIFKIIDEYIKNENIEKIMSKYSSKKNKKNDIPKIRKAKIEDIETILEIKNKALSYQIENNNLQWSSNYPNKDLFINDIEKGYGYVLELDNKIIAYAALCYGIDEMYINFFEGNIDNSIKYSSIHRVMVDRDYMGKNIATEFLKKIIRISVKDSVFTIRIDTKEDNISMLKVMKKLNFVYIAKVYAQDNTTRVVYELKI